MSEGAAKKEDKPRKFQAIRGTRDLLPPETALWNRVEQTAHEVFETFGFGEIRPPIFEQTELFARAVGGETDIVSKEMYTFTNPTSLAAVVREGRTEGMLSDMLLSEAEMISLRPEATASACRAYIEHNMQQLPQPVKLYYTGPMFRRERPQKGRYRQFYQIGAEVLGGSDAPAIDGFKHDPVLEPLPKPKLRLLGPALARLEQGPHGNAGPQRNPGGDLHRRRPTESP